jgi:hypothetical protein
MNKPNKGGRPKLDRPPHPNRQLARMSDEEFEELKAAAAQLGQPFSTWARGVLLRAAKRVLKEKGGE